MPDRDADRASIRAIVAEHERGFNENDPERLTAHYRELSWAVDAKGAPPDQFARFAPGHVEFLGDDVAIVHAYVSAATADGAPLDVGHSMIKLYVFARAAGGAWEVVARQDTL